MSRQPSFLATLSHDLRSPLTAVKEGVGLLADGSLGPLNEEQLRFLTLVDKNVDKLIKLIEELPERSSL